MNTLEIFLPGLSKFEDIKLEVQFKKDTELKLCKSKTAPFKDNLSTAYDGGIKTVIWK